MSQRYAPLSELRRIRELDRSAVFAAMRCCQRSRPPATPGPATSTSSSVEEMPACGSNDEVLRDHRLDGEGVAERVPMTLRAGA
jgi:hypothetical protein